MGGNETLAQNFMVKVMAAAKVLVASLANSEMIKANRVDVLARYDSFLETVQAQFEEQPETYNFILENFNGYSVLWRDNKCSYYILTSKYEEVRYNIARQLKHHRDLWESFLLLILRMHLLSLLYDL
ncbi:hypothetical protein CHUAL_012522 [Chamberlinius hualienensis]